ncbi:MAG TPA: response regulator [Steroidobacteraceae bacterium]|nr:response regulator [Steroidobacteraceae bacterium]
MGKRALIVDDSRSARVILSRMLEQHGLAVDTAESAEQALEYLQHKRPDVIFLDHLMPGMDGFEAVQIIKGNPQTATIPLMMYTSQEGELYVSQARALGAIGVLPKTVRPADVSRLLYQLHLLPDRRQDRSALFEPAERESGVHRPAPVARAAGGEAPAADIGSDRESMPEPQIDALQANLRQSMQQLVKDQLAEQRRFVLATFEAFARRLNGEIKDVLAKIPVGPVEEPLPPPPPPRQWWPILTTGLLAVLPSLLLAFLCWHLLGTSQQLGRELAESRAAEAAAVAQAEAVNEALALWVQAPPPGRVEELPSRPAPEAAIATSGPMAIEFVPYGEAPFSGRRLERLRGLAETLASQQFQGRVLMEAFVGDFCLDGDPMDGFSVAEPATPVRECSLVGNPYVDSLSLPQYQSVAFANFVASLRQRTGGAIRVEVSSAGRREPIAYPELGEGTKAGDWNTVAAQNNRVEYRLMPDTE